MKVSILTLHAVSNYGTQLQAYASQEKLKEYFDEVELIDYKRKDTYGKELINNFAKGNPIKKIAIYPTIVKWRRVFGKFQKQYLYLTKQKYLDEKDFKNFILDSDAYVSGSDQIWNSGWNRGVIPELYLSFVPKDKFKFTFSSSFGNIRVTEEEISLTKKYIDEYDCISVREESGLKILEEQYRYKNAIRLVDPTLAYNGDYWRNFSKDSNKKINEKYILIYNLNRSKDFDIFAKKIAQKTGLKVYRFCTRYDQIFRYGKSLLIPEIKDFVSLVDNAEFVLTDSFHAVAFSINLNTMPICIYPNNYSGRIAEFLKLINCEQLHVKNYDDLDVLNRKINYEKTNNILDSERLKIDNYLKKVKETIESGVK